MVTQADGSKIYSAKKRHVEQALRSVLDEWVPRAEQTTRPAHLDTWAAEDKPAAPKFIREWFLRDMERPDTINPAFLSETGCTWEGYHYDQALQHKCDHLLHTRVSPGYGGVAQELWIHAPPSIRERERLIINTILRSGRAPDCLKHKQMVFLPKTADANGIVNLNDGLPPWRPITIFSAFASRVFMVIRNYVQPALPNDEMQHGFQRDKSVQDAVRILTTLLLEQAKNSKQRTISSWVQRLP